MNLSPVSLEDSFGALAQIQYGLSRRKGKDGMLMNVEKSPINEFTRNAQLSWPVKFLRIFTCASLQVKILSDSMCVRLGQLVAEHTTNLSFICRDRLVSYLASYTSLHFFSSQPNF